MVQEAIRGAQDKSKQEFPGQQEIGIKGSQNAYSQQPGYQDPAPQYGAVPPEAYYPMGIPPGSQLMPANPYAKGLAMSVVVMAIGALLEKFFYEDHFYPFNNHPVFYAGVVLFFLGAISAFLFGLGLFLLPPRQDQSTNGPSNLNFGIAFVLAAIVLGIALH